MSNGATVAALNHINEQAKTGQAHIMACHVKNETLPWDDAVEVVAYDALQDMLAQVDFTKYIMVLFFRLESFCAKKTYPMSLWHMVD